MQHESFKMEYCRYLSDVNETETIDLWAFVQSDVRLKTIWVLSYMYL